MDESKTDSKAIELTDSGLHLTASERAKGSAAWIAKKVESTGMPFQLLPVASRMRYMPMLGIVDARRGNSDLRTLDLPRQRVCPKLHRMPYNAFLFPAL